LFTCIAKVRNVQLKATSAGLIKCLEAAHDKLFLLLLKVNLRMKIQIVWRKKVLKVLQ